MMKKFLIIFLAFFCFACLVDDASAQNKMALSITPPLIKNNVNPGQIWKSYIKVVNNNDEEMNVYVQFVNFESGNESGTVRLTPLTDNEIEGNEYLINNWIHMDEGPINIPGNKSKEIPFIVDVPDKADPGDHHVAILIGTKPKKDADGGSSISISSMIGSLLLLNVNGEINEEGLIREFLSDKDIYSSGDVNLKLRFQNTGNTILQPKGEIRIFNFQNKDQGHIKINHLTSTGNVFPEDVRSWDYKWPVPTSLLKMGKYRAEMLLSYGDHGKVEDRTVYFWVLQMKPILITVSSFFLLVLMIVLLVKRSIKKAVLRTQEQIGLLNPSINNNGKKIKVLDDMHAVVDLKVAAAESTKKPAKTQKKQSIGWSLLKKIFVVLFVSLFLLLLVFVYFYFNSQGDRDVLLEEVGTIKDELIIIDDKLETDEKKVVDMIVDESIEEVIKKDEVNTGTTEESEGDSFPEEKNILTKMNKDISIVILNGSGKAGMAGIAKAVIEKEGFKIEKTANADSFDYTNTTIKYSETNKEEAEFLSKTLGVKASLELLEESDSDIIIIIAKDFK